MPETLRVLGQAAPGAGVDAAAYTVPAARSAVVSSLVACNTSGAVRLVRVHARVGGAAAATGNAVVYDLSVAAGETVALTLGITLAATDVLGVRSDLGGVTFTAFGSEVA